MDDSKLAPEMAKPSEMLRDLVEEGSPHFVMGQTELAERVGVVFQTVHRWCKGLTAFPEFRQRQVAAVLGLPPTYFSAYDDVVVRERYRQKKFAEFLADELGATANEEERRLLAAPRFDEKIVPTVSIYRAWLLVLRGILTEEQVERALEEHRRILEIAKAKVEAQRSAKRSEKSEKKKKTPRH